MRLVHRLAAAIPLLVVAGCSEPTQVGGPVVGTYDLITASGQPVPQPATDLHHYRRYKSASLTFNGDGTFRGEKRFHGLNGTADIEFSYEGYWRVRGNALELATDDDWIRRQWYSVAHLEGNSELLTIPAPQADDFVVIEVYERR
jgi:hypothetical protein